MALADGLPRGERKAWPSPIAESIPEILAHRGEPVAVLASGDPYCFGVGAMLSAHVPVEETICVPAPSSLSLACARLGWALDDVAAVSLCGRPIETLAPALQPKRRVLALSADATTPAAVARYLSARGFEQSTLHVLEALGGPRERMRGTTADRFGFNDVEALNLVAIEVEASAGAKIIPLGSGLPDDMFEHDGQITKREIRAVTLSSLSPRAGELLWDIGCGSGSVAIEWLLRHPQPAPSASSAIRLRAARAARNAAELGVPRFEVVTGEAQAALDALPAPDAIFIGGGGEPALIDKAYAALQARRPHRRQRHHPRHRAGGACRAEQIRRNADAALGRTSRCGRRQAGLPPRHDGHAVERHQTTRGDAMTVHFIGAGPGAPDLLTLRGADLIARCPVCLYAGSLVNPEILALCPEGARLVDTAPMSLDEIVAEFEAAHHAGRDVARLHSGDLSVWSAVGEQLRRLDALGIPYTLTPGVPAFAAAAAALRRELTLPEVAQSLVLTRTSGRASAMPPRETLPAFAATGATLVLHLSIQALPKVVEELTPHYGADCPAAVVVRASWPDERIIEATLGTLLGEVANDPPERTALILVGRVLAAEDFRDSALYDANYRRRYRLGGAA